MTLKDNKTRSNDQYFTKMALNTRTGEVALGLKEGVDAAGDKMIGADGLVVGADVTAGISVTKVGAPVVGRLVTMAAKLGASDGSMVTGANVKGTPVKGIAVGCLAVGAKLGKVVGA